MINCLSMLLIIFDLKFDSHFNASWEGESFFNFQKITLFNILSLKFVINLVLLFWTK